jgi:hypothetical protein
VPNRRHVPLVIGLALLVLVAGTARRDESSD